MDNVSALHNITRSLRDLLGDAYVNAVVEAASELSPESRSAHQAAGTARVDFCPREFVDRADTLLARVGERVCSPLVESSSGAPTTAFANATKVHQAPLGGLGCVRIGQDGRAYLIGKSEHYHAALGHRFPGYSLVARAHELGIDNITHNNTRGHITRTLERSLVAACNGIAANDGKLAAVLNSQDDHVLNRVINLETGSLAVEAGLKMMLSRFYAVEDGQPAPEYAGRTPVFLVVGDLEGGITANYHGTTILTQVLRGMWPDMARKLADSGLYRVEPVGINDIDSVRAAIDKYDQAPYKIAGFMHEIVMMNYGGKLLSREFLREAYSICHEHNIPILADEIQSCAWSRELFLFREYGLNPDFVAVGKGFPGGNAPASRIITTAPMDRLAQFGALVTNGQEELASLYYLITMEFVRENGAAITAIGEYYESRLREIATRHGQLVNGIEGLRHMCGISFQDHHTAGAFVSRLNAAGIDISAQSYKVQSLPVALTKLPVVATRATVDFLLDHVERALAAMAAEDRQ